MVSTVLIMTVHNQFTRHERRYCIFSITGRDEEYLYYSHMDRPLRSLMFGRDFLTKLPGLMKEEDLCIECGMGLSIKGGVALDAGDLLAWHCTVDNVNTVLTMLKEKLGEEGYWIELF